MVYLSCENKVIELKELSSYKETTEQKCYL